MCREVAGLNLNGILCSRVAPMVANLPRGFMIVKFWCIDGIKGSSPLGELDSGLCIIIIVALNCCGDNCRYTRL